MLAGQIAGRCGDLAAVTEDDVLAIAGHHCIDAEAGDHDVLAVAGGDLVVAAHAGGDRPDAVDVVRARRIEGVHAQQLVGQVVHQAVVAEDDVVAVTLHGAAGTGEGVDDIVRAAAEDHVAAHAGGDRVVAVAVLVARAVDRAEVDRRDQAQHLDLVVVIGPAGIAHRAVDTGVDTEDEAVIAEHNVLAGTGIDVVVALAADDDVVGAVVGDDVALAQCRGGVDALDHVERGEVGVGRAEVVG